MYGFGVTLLCSFALLVSVLSWGISYILLRKKPLRLLISTLVAGMFFSSVLFGIPLLLELLVQQPYLDPSEYLSDTDLEGEWTVNYGYAIDRIFIGDDGMFKQIYTGPSSGNFRYETEWSEYSIERFQDGRVRLHLPGASYFLAGLSWLENCNDHPDSCWVYDPISGESLDTKEELLLNVRSSKDGELILLHMWVSSDRGYALFGSRSEEFRRVLADK